MNINGKTRIFKNEKDGNVYYTTTLSNKLENGTYDNATVKVQFMKDIEPAEGNINILDGFITFYRKKDNTLKLKYVIKKYKEDTVDNLPF